MLKWCTNHCTATNLPLGKRLFFGVWNINLARLKKMVSTVYPLADMCFLKLCKIKRHRGRDGEMFCFTVNFNFTTKPTKVEDEY